MPDDREVPPLGKRVLPLFWFASVIAAVRLGLDAFAPDWPPTMKVSVYFALALALAWIGLTRRWGPIGWKPMALTMAVLAVAVFGLWNTIAYTTGQFMEWTHGRFDPGERVVGADGTVDWRGGRNAPVRETALAKIGAGLLHGVLSSLAGTAWCTAFGTVLVWLPARLTRWWRQRRLRR